MCGLSRPAGPRQPVPRRGQGPCKLAGANDRLEQEVANAVQARARIALQPIRKIAP